MYTASGDSIFALIQMGRVYLIVCVIFFFLEQPGSKVERIGRQGHTRCNLNENR